MVTLNIAAAYCGQDTQYSRLSSNRVLKELTAVDLRLLTLIGFWVMLLEGQPEQDSLSLSTRSVD